MLHARALKALAIAKEHELSCVHSFLVEYLPAYSRSVRPTRLNLRITSVERAQPSESCWPFLTVIVVISSL